MVDSLSETNSLSVDVTDLLARPGANRRLEFDIPVDGLAVALAEVDGSVRGTLRFESLVEGIHVGGALAGKAVLRCRRCLTEVPDTFDVSVNELFMVPSEEAEDGGAYLIGDDQTIDLEPLMRDLVVLSLPLNPLCREDCQGLCPVCGMDRNTTNCGHDGGATDIRWGPLEQLRERLEG